MVGLIARLAQSTVVHGAFAFALMGSWALWSNRSHPMPAPLLAGALQGLLSATITVTLKTALDALRQRMAGLWALLAPPVAALSVSLCVLLAVHRIGGTPEILLTIAVPFGTACLYAFTYNALRWRLGQ